MFLFCLHKLYLHFPNYAKLTTMLAVPFNTDARYVLSLYLSLRLNCSTTDMKQFVPWTVRNENASVLDKYFSSAVCQSIAESHRSVCPARFCWWLAARLPRLSALWKPTISSRRSGSRFLKCPSNAAGGFSSPREGILSRKNVV